MWKSFTLCSTVFSFSTGGRMVILRGEQRQPGRRLPTGAEARTPQLQPPTCRWGTRRSGPAALSTARAPA